MCLAKVNLPKDEGGLLADIALLKVEDGKVYLRTLFGQEKELEAKVKEIDFQNSTILLETKVESKA